MYSRKRAKLPDNITLDWILSKVTEYDIYAKYIGQFKVGMIYNSPFRKDKNPSFGIYYSKRTKQLLFKDHGTGECGNVIKFVSLFTGKTEYNDILSDIVDKLNITNNTKLVSSKQYIPPTETVIGVVRQEFTDVDINYWKQFNISINTLKKFNVNSIKYYFSNGYYGIEAAARGYFGKSASELSVSQQAFIAAIPNNPTKYNPLTNYDATITRRNLILKELRDADYIDSMTYNTAIAEEITITGQKAANKNSSVETYARHCATEELMKYYGFTMRNNFDTEDEYNTYEELYQQYYSSCQQMLINGGYTIYTSIDPDIQASLQESIDNNLSSFKKVSDDGIYELQGAATCIDNSTGNVVAIVGSRSQDDIDGYTLNRAYQSYRQPGSCIKPVIVYVPYLQLGNNPDTIVNDERIDGGPSNADGTYSGQMTLRTAVSKSKNTVAWKIYRDDITPKAGIGFLLNMGFHKIWMDKSTNAAALGGFTYGVSTEEMAGAYATIVNDGEYRQPTCVEKILNTSGKAIVDTSKRSSRVYDTNSCRMMTDMLRTVVTSGTGVGAEPSNAIVAGKTGTTNSNKDAWFCGYSQYYTTAIWMGYDYPKTLSSVKTLAIFKDFMYDIHKDKKKVEFKTANGSYTKKNQTETETQSQTEEQTTTQQETTTVTPTTKAATTTQQATTKAQTPTTQQAATKTQQTKEQRTGEWEVPTKEDAPAQNISPY